MTLVAGSDTSTQSCKVVGCAAETGESVRSASAPHPDGTEVDPRHWRDAWLTASAGLLEGVRALAVAGQQHGMVALDTAGQVVRPALLWNDTRSADAAHRQVAEQGGPPPWAEAVGSEPTMSFTVTKLRWLTEREPESAARVARVLLPHDWLTWRLLDGAADPVTDRGDASGTGYWAPREGRYRTDLIRHAFGREIEVPRVAGLTEVVGETPAGTLVAPGTGDNMGAALGLGAQAGDIIVSIGTSGTVFAVHDDAAADASGVVAGFVVAFGWFLSLVWLLFVVW